jgi:twinkle protein
VPAEHSTSFTQTTLEYVPWRGIAAESFSRYGAKTRVSSDGEPLALVLPWLGHNQIRSVTEKKFWIEGEAQPCLFGQDKFDSGCSKHLIITEGALDAISAWQMVQTPAVAVRSASSAVRDVASCRSWVQGFEHVYLCFDSDAPGREAASGVAKLLGVGKVLDVRLTRHKDANAYLVAGDEADFYRVWSAAGKYKPDTIVSDLNSFKKLLSEQPQWGVPYPWKTLNDMTFGIRPGEFVLFTAQEGVGKSSVLRAIEHKILKETTSNVGALYFEESRKEHLEHLLSTDFGSPVHLPTTTITADQKARRLEELLVRDDRLFVLQHDGSDSADSVADAIRLLVAGYQCRTIFLDHFNLCGSMGRVADERRELDYLTTVLKLMCEELNFALIGVAHVNDFGETRGSRYIAKAANIRVDLTRDVEGGSDLMHVNISKNRYAAKTGAAGTLKFNYETYRLEEVTTAANDNGCPLANVG